jgi:predicted negative regulator of RcsB-dependent stress response
MPSKSQTVPTLSSADPVLESHVLWDRYKTLFFIVLAVIVLGVGAWAAFRVVSDRREDAAANALAAAKNAADYQKVITQYDGTPAGESAYLFLAEDQRKEKKFEEANATLQKFVDKFPNHQLKATARMTMAANLESLGKVDEALSAYQRLATDDPQGYAAPVAMIAQARILKQKNQLEEARKVCESILTQYRESSVATEAQRQLNMMKAKEPGKMLQLNPQNLTPNTAPRMKVSVPPQPVPAGPPGAAPKAAEPPKK